MPSAGRPFTPELITDLVARGILVAPILLHAGVSSPERDEPPFPEEYEVPAHTAALVQSVRGAGGRVIAVGTTVVRALETAARGRERPRAGHGWTSLVITPEHRLAAVDGLITGWHEPAGLAPADARGDRRAASSWRTATRARLTTAISGTSSATAISSCPERARGAWAEAMRETGRRLAAGRRVSGR